VYRRADYIFTVTEGARRNLISKGVPPAKVAAMPHWFDEPAMRPDAAEARDRVRREFDWDGKFVALFAGNLGLVQGLETVVRAAEWIPPESGIRIALVGDGADKPRLLGLVDALGLLGRVQFIDRQPMERMPELFAAADGLLVHLKHSDLSDS